MVPFAARKRLRWPVGCGVVCVAVVVAVSVLISRRSNDDWINLGGSDNLGGWWGDVAPTADIYEDPPAASLWLRQGISNREFHQSVMTLGGPTPIVTDEIGVKIFFTRPQTCDARAVLIDDMVDSLVGESTEDGRIIAGFSDPDRLTCVMWLATSALPPGRYHVRLTLLDANGIDGQSLDSESFRMP